MSPGNAHTQVRVARVGSGADQGDSYVRVSSVGDVGERAFVLVPGIGVSSNYFERLAPNLNEYGPVHALDLPGFGGVPHPDRALQIADFADLVGRAIDELGLSDPIVVGHSMGTQVVTDLAARRPDLTTIVLIGPVVSRMERSIPRQGVRFLRSASREPGRVKGLAVSAYLLCGVRWFSRVLPEMMKYRIEDRIGDITASVLLIRGEHDACSPRDWVLDLAARHPRNKVWEIPGAAHSVMYAHAEEVAELCVRYARDPGADDDRLHQLTDAVASTPRMTPRATLRRVRGRLLELRGIAGDDDAEVAAGRTEQAEAQTGAEGQTPRSTT